MTSQRQQNEQRYPCTYCHAQVGEPCTTLNGISQHSHVARLRALWAAESTTAPRRTMYPIPPAETDRRRLRHARSEHDA